ncbi:MAG TPA: insulinase family protein [Woeseiaceae bacterium]|nr:insulinase family protein [Woeseiaceae bacterium]
MRKILAAVALGVIGVACDSSAPPHENRTTDTSEHKMSRIFDMPYLMRDLDNGLRVIVVRTDYPDIVTLQIPVQTGSRNEVEPGKSGFAHFFEHMMFRGTQKYPADVYAAILKKMGADQNAYTTDDYTNYHTTFTKDDLEKMLEIEADRFQNLDYSEAAFRTEALAVKGEYLKNYSNPTAKAYERVRDLAFDVHTYQHTTMGFIQDIEAMPDQLEYSKQFFDRWYRPEKTSVIVVGDVDPEQTFELVRKYWGSWEKGDYTVDVPVEPPLASPVYEHIRWEGPTQPWLFIAFRGPALDPTGKEMPAMDLIASIYFSESSDVYKKLVLEDQSVDQLMAYFPNRKDPNLLMFYARLTDEKHAAAVEAAINATLADARTRLVESRKVEETKSRLRYMFTSQLDSSGGIGSVLAAYVQFARTPETINEVYESYEGLTASDLRDAAMRYFVDSGRVTVSLSSGAGMAGIDGESSIDAIVAAADEAQVDDAVPAGRESASAPREEEQGDTVAGSGTRADVPVSIVAQPSDSSPLVDVAFVVHAGAAMDPPGKKGLAALTAAMISEGGSTSHTIQEINDAMYPIASGFDAQVDKEMTRLSGQVHKDNLQAWYDLIKGQMLHPGWREQDFRRVKTQLVNAIRTSLVGNNDEELGKEVLYSEVYGEGHPYGSLNLGHTGYIEAITLADVKKFYADFYTVGNLTVGLAGGYPEEFAATVGEDLQTLPAGTRAKREIPAAPALDANEAVIVEKETPAVAVSLGFPIELTRGDPDWLALWLARSYLGEHRSTNAHLFQRIREERGMNYGDYAYIEYFPRGMFQFHPDTNLARQQQIFQIWIRPVRNNNDAHFATRTAVFELQKLIDEGMTESDFEATRSFLSKFVSLLTDGQSRQLGYEIDSQFYETGRFSEYVRDGLAALTLEGVNRVIRENLAVDGMQYVFVTKDAADLRRRLVDDAASPITYDSAKADELLREDEQIATFPLEFGEDAVRVVPSEEVFQ